MEKFLGSFPNDDESCEMFELCPWLPTRPEAYFKPDRISSEVSPCVAVTVIDIHPTPVWMPGLCVVTMTFMKGVSCNDDIVSLF